MERETGFEPATSSLGKRSNIVHTRGYGFHKRTKVHAVSPVFGVLARMEAQRFEVAP
jgi:hypothetical protein